MATPTPNFSLTGNPNPLALPTNQNMSSTTPMGAPAKMPTSAPPDNSIPPNQIKPQQPNPSPATTDTSPASQTAAVGNTGLVGNPNSLFQSSAQGLYDMSKDPQLQQMLSEYSNIAQSQPVALTNIMNDTTRGLPYSVQQAREGATNEQYSQQLAAKSAQIQTYLQGKGLNISALQGAGQLSQPQSQLGFLTNPFTGQPVYGNGTLGGLAGLSYQAGQIQNAGNLAGQGQTQAIAINNARNATTQLGNLLKTSNLNQNQLALSNWVGNVVAQNLSNPTLAPIQNAITSAINQYAQATGVSPADLTNSLLLQSGSQSIMSVLNNLDTQAYNNHQNTQNVATGGGVAAPVTNLGTAQNTQSGTTAGGNKYVISQ